MKFSTVIAASVALTASLVSAQIDGLPTCASTCAIGGLSSTGCQLTDFACICKATSFITSISTCVKTACNAADYTTTLNFAANLCKQNGVTLDVSSIAAGAGSSSTAASGATSTAASGATTTASSVSSKVSSVLSSAAAVTSSIKSALSSATSAAAGATKTPSAGNSQGVNWGLGAVAAVLAAAL